VGGGQEIVMGLVFVLLLSMTEGGPLGLSFKAKDSPQLAKGCHERQKKLEMTREKNEVKASFF